VPTSALGHDFEIRKFNMLAFDFAGIMTQKKYAFGEQNEEIMRQSCHVVEK